MRIFLAQNLRGTVEAHELATLDRFEAVLRCGIEVVRIRTMPPICVGEKGPAGSDPGRVKAKVLRAHQRGGAVQRVMEWLSWLMRTSPIPNRPCA